MKKIELTRNEEVFDLKINSWYLFEYSPIKARVNFDTPKTSFLVKFISFNKKRSRSVDSPFLYSTSSSIECMIVSLTGVKAGVMNEGMEIGQIKNVNQHLSNFNFQYFDCYEIGEGEYTSLIKDLKEKMFLKKL